MKLKYLYIIVVVAVLNILNTSTAIADLTTAPEEVLCFCIFPPIIAVISIIIGIFGIRYIKNQRSKVNENSNPEIETKDNNQL